MRLSGSWRASRADRARPRDAQGGRPRRREGRVALRGHPNSSLIKGVVCGVRVEDIEDPLMRKIRYLDKLIDELAKGKAMEKILRQ